MSYFGAVGLPLLASTPVLLAWLVGIILAIRMLRRGGRAERLLLVGCCLMFAARVTGPFLAVLASWLTAEGGMSRAGVTGLVVSAPTSVLSMVGIICLVFAFWIHWKTKATI